MNRATMLLARVRPRSAGTGARIGLLFWLAVLLLTCIAMASMAVGLSNRQSQWARGKNLQDDSAVSKLNTGTPEATAPTAELPPAEPEGNEPAPSDGKPALVPTPAVELPQIVDARPALREVPAEPPFVGLMPLAIDVPREATPEEPVAAPEVTETVSEPAIDVYRRAPTSGETPMIRTWNTLALAALLAAAPPVLAGGEKEKDTDAKAILKAVEELRKNVDALSKKIDAAPTAANHKQVVGDIKKLGETVEKANDELKTRIAAMETEHLKQKLELQGLKLKLESLGVAPSDKAAMDEIRSRLSAIERSLGTLSTDGSIRKAFSPPANGSLARVMLVNLYTEDMLFVINDRNFRVEPNRTMQINDVPPGALTYQVISPTWGSRALRTTSIQPNDTLTLTAR
jgi:hypothetical protein